MKPVVLIVGDSWAGGEWDGGNPPRLLHQGIEQYFTDAGYKVTNLRASGKGNHFNISRLSEHLARVSHIKYIIFFIVSEPLRNYSIPFDTLHADIKKYNGLFELQQYVMYKDFETLDLLAAKHNTNIHLIGGLSAVPTFVNQFANLNCLVQSWPKLLVGDLPQYKNIDWNTFGIWGKWQAALAQILSPSSDIDQKVIDQLDILANNNKVFLHELFNPDGSHPNRTGHQILFDFICKKLEL